METKIDPMGIIFKTHHNTSITQLLFQTDVHARAPESRPTIFTSPHSKRNPTLPTTTTDQSQPQQYQGSTSNQNQGPNQNQPYRPPNMRGSYRGNQGNNNHYPRQQSGQQGYQGGSQPRPSRSLEELVGEMQDAYKEQKASLDQLTRQMSQLETSMNEMRGNEDRITAQVQNPNKANVSQITLRSDKETKGPQNVSEKGKEKEQEPDPVKEWDDDKSEAMEVEEPTSKGKEFVGKESSTSQGIQGKVEGHLKQVLEPEMQAPAPTQGD